MPKLNRKLTETEIRNAKPKDKAYKLYDEGGLYLLIRPTGTKVWQYPYRHNNKYNVYTIGRVGEIGSAEARQLRDQARKMIREGLDPNQNKKSKRQEVIETHKNNFEAMAREWYSKQQWADKYATNILNRLEKDVFPYIGRKPVKDVSVRDILEVLKRMEGRGALEVAKRVNQYCTNIFDYAIAKDLCDNNPALGRSKLIKSYKVKNRPHLSEKELPTFIENLKASPHSLTKLAVELLVLTFVRPGELRGARWGEIDEEKAIWHIPAERMKRGRDHLVPLSSQALEVIRAIKQISGNREFLFPGQPPIKPISDVGLIKAVKKLSQGKSVPHGFRHTASTILNERGFNGDHVEMQLSHMEENKIRGTYNKAQYLDARRQMMQWWGDYLRLGHEFNSQPAVL